MILIPSLKKSVMLKRILKSFVYAFRGMSDMFRTQRNARIHLLAVLVVIIAGTLIGVTLTEWCILILCMAMVISLEALNSAIEKLADIANPAYDSRIGEVKDLAAAAVLIASLASIVIAIIIFAPYLI
jgi:diacylglycerol kinase